MNGNNDGNANNAGGVVVAAQQQQLRGTSKPSLFEGTFELYQAELELYLGDRDAWDVAKGVAGPAGTSDDLARTSGMQERRRVEARLLLRQAAETPVVSVLARTGPVNGGVHSHHDPVAAEIEKHGRGACGHRRRYGVPALNGHRDHVKGTRRLSSSISAILEALGRKFTMKDLGRVRHLLSMEIHYEPGVMLCLSQTAYITELLERFQMNMARSVGSPQMHNEKMMPLERDGTKINDPSIPYREIVGKLQYLVTCTRLDIANVIRCLGRHAGAYTKENFASDKRVLQYLQGAKTFGLVYRRSDAKPAENLQLRVYSDADHANCPDTGRSVTGYVIQLNGYSFGFKSKKQERVTDDTCKSELVAASKSVEDKLWTQNVLTEIGLKPMVPELHCDNQSIIKGEKCTLSSRKG
ncbi:hypothetical protein ON010_g14956 [Phytophthora cinnamomi]|nr:hypothetical protein ON010_g14956 [Phytophthora cinnamomi]